MIKWARLHACKKGLNKTTCNKNLTEYWLRESEIYEKNAKMTEKNARANEKTKELKAAATMIIMRIVVSI